MNPGSGQASLVVDKLLIEDYFNVVNALNDGSNNPATVSFKIHWAPGTNRLKVRDQATQVKAEFVRVLTGMYHNRIDYPEASGGITKAWQPAQPTAEV